MWDLTQRIKTSLRQNNASTCEVVINWSQFKVIATDKTQTTQINSINHRGFKIFFNFNRRYNCFLLIYLFIYRNFSFLTVWFNSQREKKNIVSCSASFSFLDSTTIEKNVRSKSHLPFFSFLATEQKIKSYPSFNFDCIYIWYCYFT